MKNNNFNLKKKFITNLALLLFLNLLIKPFWIFGIDRTVQNVVGAGEYGFYFSLFNFSLLLNILLDFGITNFNNREIARNPHMLSKSFSNIVGLKFVLAFFYAFAGLIIALIIGYDRHQLYLLGFLVLNQFLASFLLYLRSNLSGLQMFRTDSLLSVLDRGIMIGICSILLWTRFFDGEFRIEWFIYAQTVAYFFSVVVAFFLVLLKAGFFTFRFDLKLITLIIRKSYPFALLTILMSGYYRIDSVMLERMLPEGNVEAGIYAQAFRILDAFTMFAFLFATLLFPMFSRMIKKGNPVQSLTFFSFMLLIVPVLIISVTLIFFRTEFMGWLYYEHTHESARVLLVLMVAHIFISATYIFGTLLTAGGHLKELNITAGVGLGLNIILNLLFIPGYAALGSAFASLVTQILVMFVQVILVFRIFRFKLPVNLVVRLVVFIIILFVLGWASTLLHISWFVKAAGIIIFSGMLALMTGLIKVPVLAAMFTLEEETILSE